MAEGDTVSVVITITKKDYAAAVRGMMTRPTWRVWNTVFWISLAVLAYFLYEAVRLGTMKDIFGLLWAVGIVLFIGFLKFGAPLLAARDFVRKNPDILAATNQIIGPSGVITENARGKATLGWNAYQRVQETSDLFLLYPQSNYAIIVPKRCFNSLDDIQRYREIIKRYCSGKLELRN